jgi:hypothetical protein
MTNQLKKDILDIIKYGVEWTDSSEDNYPYKAGSFETVGFIVACFLCQRTKLFPNGLAASDVVQILRLDEYLSESVREKLLDDLCDVKN